MALTHKTNQHTPRRTHVTREIRFHREMMPESGYHRCSSFYNSYGYETVRNWLILTSLLPTLHWVSHRQKYGSNTHTENKCIGIPSMFDAQKEGADTPPGVILLYSAMPPLLCRNFRVCSVQQWHCGSGSLVWRFITRQDAAQQFISLWTQSYNPGKLLLQRCLPCKQ